MKFDNKDLGASFELDDNVTQRGLELYEHTALDLLNDSEHKSTADIYRANVSGAINGGFYTPGKNCPESIADLDGNIVAVMSWISYLIDKHIE